MYCMSYILNFENTIGQIDSSYRYKRKEKTGMRYVRQITPISSSHIVQHEWKSRATYLYSIAKEQQSAWDVSQVANFRQHDWGFSVSLPVSISSPLSRLFAHPFPVLSSKQLEIIGWWRDREGYRYSCRVPSWLHSTLISTKLTLEHPQELSPCWGIPLFAACKLNYSLIRQSYILLRGLLRKRW